MRVETVEVYSEKTNAAVMRHPDRKFPGVLIQGDSLHSLCVGLDALCSNVRSQTKPETYQEANQLRNSMWAYLNHYKTVLEEHGIPLPFSERPSS